MDASNDATQPHTPLSKPVTYPDLARLNSSQRPLTHSANIGIRRHKRDFLINGPPRRSHSEAISQLFNPAERDSPQATSGPTRGASARNFTQPTYSSNLKVEVKKSTSDGARSCTSANEKFELNTVRLTRPRETLQSSTAREHSSTQRSTERTDTSDGPSVQLWLESLRNNPPHVPDHAGKPSDSRTTSRSSSSTSSKEGRDREPVLLGSPPVRREPISLAGLARPGPRVSFKIPYRERSRDPSAHAPLLPKRYQSTRLPEAMMQRCIGAQTRPLEDTSNGSDKENEHCDPSKSLDVDHDKPQTFSAKTEATIADAAIPQLSPKVLRVRKAKGKVAFAKARCPSYFDEDILPDLTPPKTRARAKKQKDPIVG
ncbi:MAG: hypothetical protein M1828_007006 [Chrysothrix sp. TS-e1954]|nr:MAG: hypothetical protein M1828_007006 [Chrysothrix sp. TS-e1954]